MKKVNKVFLSLVLVFVLAMPLLTGCSLFGNSNKTLVGIELTGNIKTEYLLNENIDFNGQKLRLIYDDNSRVTLNLDESMVSGFSTTTKGNKTMTIEYNEYQKTINYSVNLFKMGRYTNSSTDYYNGNTVVYTQNWGSLQYLELSSNFTIVGGFVETNSEAFRGTWQYLSNQKIKIVLDNNGGEREFNIVNTQLLQIETIYSGEISGHSYESYTQPWAYAE